METEQTRVDYYSIDMLSTSRLKLFAQYTPLKAWYLAKEKPVETPALIMGRACHAAVLEPEQFDKEFVFLPDDFRGTTKDGKALKKEIIDSGRLPLTKDQKEVINGICNRILGSKNAKALIAGNVEQEFFGEMQGLPYKAKMDTINPKKRFISDLKTTLDATPEVFIKECEKRGYFTQAFAYIEMAKQAGIEIDKFFFIAVEKKAPYCCSIIEVSDIQMQIGEAHFNHAMALYKFALKNPTYDYDVFPQGQKHFVYDTPNWIVKKYLGDDND